MNEPVTEQNHADRLQDPAYLKEIQQQMLKFAELQLKDYQLAEDAVQEALIGAMKNAKSFSGRSAFKTWVFAILKNKIADILRKRHRTVEITNLASSSDESESDMSNFFDEKGHWTEDGGTKAWGDPEQSFDNDEFWTVFEACLQNLPEQQAKIFMMREFIGLNSDEICSENQISTSNLHVLLFRARVRLQKCLEIRWFEGEAQHA
jgi:RNA polymerase sigma-70 factor (ECF subfamily)